MKKIILASVLVTIFGSVAVAQQQETIVDLIAKGFEIKTSVGPLIILQNDESVYGCSMMGSSPADMKAGVIPAAKILCAPIK